VGWGFQDIVRAVALVAHAVVFGNELGLEDGPWISGKNSNGLEISSCLDWQTIALRDEFADNTCQASNQHLSNCVLDTKR
jgi:hypothetical protein